MQSKDDKECVPNSLTSLLCNRLKYKFRVTGDAYGSTRIYRTFNIKKYVLLFKNVVRLFRIISEPTDLFRRGFHWRRLSYKTELTESN